MSLPRDHYELLEQMAEDKRVSVAWVIHEAVERYLGEQ